MNKRLLVGVCGLAAAAGIFAGCGQDAQEPMRFEWSEPTTVVTEATEPAARFSFGDIVWRVCDCEARSDVHLTRYAVVEQKGDLLTLTTAITDDPETMRQVLPEYLAEMAQQDASGSYLSTVKAATCYRTEAEAQSATWAMQEG